MTRHPSISPSTIARTVVLLLALINQVLSALGRPVLPIQSDTLEQLITLGLTIGSSLWAWWKNNSFTCEACEADEYLCQLRKERPRKQ